MKNLIQKVTASPLPVVLFALSLPLQKYVKFADAYPKELILPCQLLFYSEAGVWMLEQWASCRPVSLAVADIKL